MSSGHPSAARIGINAQKLDLSASYHAAGSSHYILNLLRELRALGADEEILAYVRSAHVPDDLSPTTSFRPVRCRWPTDHPAARIVWEQFVFSRQLREDKVDLLHGAINALPVGWRGRSVVTILDLSFLVMPAAFKPANRLYLTWMARFAARRANRIITISEATRQDVIQRLGANPRNVRAIHCGVDRRFTPIRDQARLAAFRAAHGLPDEFILYLGTIEPRKNLMRLIDAYAELRRRGVTQWPLILAGGRGWHDQPIFDHAAALGLGDALRFTGFVQEDEKPLWYNAATLFVYPSEYEGFGLPPLEALACGTPVLTSDRSSLPEVMGEAAMLVDPTRVTAIADGMQQVIEDDAARAHMASAGPEQARRFTWSHMAEETLAVYQMVIRDQ